MLRGVLFCAFLIFSHLWPQSLPHVLIVVSNQHPLQHHTLIHIGGVTWCGTPKVAGRAGPALGSLGSRTTEAHCPWNAEWSPCQGPFSGGMVNQGGESWQVSPPCSEFFWTWVQVDRCWWKVSRIQLQLNSLTIVVISYMTIPAVKKSTLAAHGSSMLFFMCPWLEKSAGTHIPITFGLCVGAPCSLKRYPKRNWRIYEEQNDPLGILASAGLNPWILMTTSSPKSLKHLTTIAVIAPSTRPSDPRQTLLPVRWIVKASQVGF